MRYALLALTVLLCRENSLASSHLGPSPPTSLHRAPRGVPVPRPPDNDNVFEEVLLRGLSGAAEERRFHFPARRKRSLSASGTNFRRVEFKAFGERFRLNLTKTDDFLAPLLIVERGPSSRLLGKTAAAAAAASWTEDDAPLTTSDPSATHRPPAAPAVSSSRDCFYSGSVNGEAGSVVVGSLCNGLLGLFKHDGGEYSIEPSWPSTDGTSAAAAAATALPHYVYKADHLAKDTSASRTQSEWCSQDESSSKADQVGTASTPKGKTRSGHGRRRHRRSVSYKRNIELMVVADHLMVQRHGENLENYLMTLIAVVSSIYRNHTIGNNLNVVLSKLVMLDNEQDGPTITSSAHDALHSFCAWQHAKNEVDDQHPYHHDAAVLITRQDLCRAPGKCDTLGLAEIGTICKFERSCAVIEDNGLASAFTIAHELGHLLGLTHDEDEACPKRLGSGISKYGVHLPGTHIMAATLNFQASPWTWSACSRMYLTEMFDIPLKADCLRDQPITALPYIDTLRTQQSRMPGEQYSPEAQCVLLFGNGSTVCNYQARCGVLWCTSPNESGCRTQHTLWADGTSCGSDKWCYRGACVERAPLPEPVDGNWGDWSAYGECSRPCDGGVKKSERDCTRPEPSNGGSYCVGRRVRYKSCNRQACPDGTPDFRWQQCSRFDGHHFNLQSIPPTVKWVPFYVDRPSDKCKLFCRFENSLHAQYQLADKVIDGTKCGPDTFDMCVNGACQAAGCDHELGSSKAPDMCGVCGGDNSTCAMQSHRFVGPVEKGYNSVHLLPAGAFHVEASQISHHGGADDDTYLALLDTRGKFLLNGDYYISRYPTDIILSNGAVVQYYGSAHRVERLTIAGRLPEQLMLAVLIAKEPQPVNIQYSFVLPLHGDVFAWRITDSWSECSRTCRGKRRRKVVCVQKDVSSVSAGSAGGSQFVEVADSKCRLLERPGEEDLEEPCNTHCLLRWRTAVVGECSAYCGLGFVKVLVECTLYSGNSSVATVVSERLCEASERPRDVSPCTGLCLPAIYWYSEWSECSASCGGGTQQRSHSCKTLATGREAPEEACSSNEGRVTSRRCNVHSCPPLPQWVPGEWSQCSVSCGKGDSYRSVSCKQGEDIVDEGACQRLQPRPVLGRECQLADCPQWHAEPWQKCSVTCAGNSGVQLRLVRCKGPDGGSMPEQRGCRPADRPAERRSCISVATCPTTTTTTTTTATTVTTAVSTMMPSRATAAPPTAGPSSSSVRPAAIAQTAVTPVAVTPAVGGHDASVQARPVIVHSTAQPPIMTTAAVTRSLALSLPQTVLNQFPDAAIGHRGMDAGRYVSSGPPLSSTATMPLRYAVDASVSAGSSIIRSSQVDPKLQGVSTKLVANAPAAVAGFGTSVTSVVATRVDVQSQGATAASSKGGPQWRHGAWASCSATCGWGVRLRYVSCRSMQGEGLDDSHCSGDRPASEESCRDHYCGSWHTGRWSKCSASCGDDSVQSRYVACAIVERTLRVVNESECAASERPPSVQRCETRLPSCTGDNVGAAEPPNAAETTTGAWASIRGSTSTTSILPVAPSVTTTAASVGVNAGGWTSPATDTAPTSKASTAALSRPSTTSGSSVAATTAATTTALQPKTKADGGPVAPVTAYGFWRVGQWSSCSASCDGGWRRRIVVCQREPGSMLNCDAAAMPADVETCATSPCGTWQLGQWLPCPVTCGQGVRLRDVVCVQRNGTELPASVCSGMSKPAPAAERCYSEPCPQPAWSVTPWSPCSVTCGRGEKRRQVQCFDQATNVSSATLDELHCLMLEPRPAATEGCMLAEQCPAWHVSDWSQCSASCGSRAVQVRNVTCVLPGDGSGTADADSSNTVESRMLPWQACARTWYGNSTTDSGEPPSSSRPCQPQVPACAEWQAMAWSECSASCGRGTRSRRVTCIDPDSGQQLKPADCLASRADPTMPSQLPPVSEESCLLRPCTSWRPGPWSECSATCGNGTRWRVIYCADDHASKVIDELHCEQAAKPRGTEPCPQQRQPDCHRWTTSAWSTCSASCGPGRRLRTVQCVEAHGHAAVSNHLCLSSAEQPADNEPCVVSSCGSVSTVVATTTAIPRTYEWITQRWTACSVSCGVGVKRRTVTCVTLPTGDPVQSFRCRGLQQPKTSRECHERVCPVAYFVEPWSRCSATCGEGRQTRSVTCKSWTPEGWLTGDSTACGAQERPSAVRSCSLGPCYASYVWQTGPWTQCSALCGWGTTRRNVTCVSVRDGQKAVSRDKCNAIYQPDRSSKCYTGPCYAKSCAELQSLSRIAVDGEYHLLVQNNLVKIYCGKMGTKSPKEYLTLQAGGQYNYAHIYGRRLRRPTTCPPDDGGGDCPAGHCLPGDYDRGGHTQFMRLQLNITTLAASVDDFEYSESAAGSRKVPFGTAGDCFSSLPDCTRGHFRINLTSTDFRVSRSATWYSQGSSVKARIQRLQDGRIVQGECGGYCGSCSLQSGNGLPLELAIT